MDLTGETAVVTGAARGIGAATARLLAHHGAAVCLVDVDGEGAALVARRIGDAGGRALAVRADVTDSEAIETALARTEAELGDLSVLVNNAGIAVFDDPLALSEEQWRRCLSVDLEAAWTCARLALPRFLAHGHGTIVNVASVHSHRIIKGCFPYPVAKHGLLGLTRALAIEYADRGIRVNAVSPGYIDTPINDEQFALAEDPAAARARAHALHPPGRMGTADEVAGPICFLASKAAAFINGVSLVIDGGRSLLYHD